MPDNSSLIGTGRRALVTGAGGFIGSHLTEQLLGAGCQVRAFLRYTSHGHRGHLQKASEQWGDQLEIVHGDIRDEHAVDGAVAECDVVFHLAALIGIPYSYVHPREVVSTNVTGTLNVLMAAQRHKVPRVVNTSTSEVYGTALRTPIDEEHPLQGQSPYSASKIGADKISESFWRSFDVPVATLRPFNTYGPRQSTRAVIPTIITQLATGGVVKLGSLTPTRDFTYVEDTADAFVRVAQADAAVGEVVNAGSGREVSIGELVTIIAEIMGVPAEVNEDPARVRPARSEVGRLIADNAKAARLTGWQPRVSLRDGLARTVAWVTENLGQYHLRKYTV